MGNECCASRHVDSLERYYGVPLSVLCTYEAQLLGIDGPREANAFHVVMVDASTHTSSQGSTATTHLHTIRDGQHHNVPILIEACCRWIEGVTSIPPPENLMAAMTSAATRQWSEQARLATDHTFKTDINKWITWKKKSAKKKGGGNAPAAAADLSDPITDVLRSLGADVARCLTLLTLFLRSLPSPVLPPVILTELERNLNSRLPLEERHMLFLRVWHSQYAQSCPTEHACMERVASTVYRVACGSMAAERDVARPVKHDGWRNVVNVFLHQACIVRAFAANAAPSQRAAIQPKQGASQDLIYNALADAVYCVQSDRPAERAASSAPTTQGSNESGGSGGGPAGGGGGGRKPVLGMVDPSQSAQGNNNNGSSSQPQGGGGAGAKQAKNVKVHTNTNDTDDDAAYEFEAAHDHDTSDTTSSEGSPAMATTGTTVRDENSETSGAELAHVVAVASRSSSAASLLPQNQKANADTLRGDSQVQVLPAPHVLSYAEANSAADPTDDGQSVTSSHPTRNAAPLRSQSSIVLSAATNTPQQLDLSVPAQQRGVTHAATALPVDLILPYHSDNKENVTHHHHHHQHKHASSGKAATGRKVNQASHLLQLAKANFSVGIEAPADYTPQLETSEGHATATKGLQYDDENDVDGAQGEVTGVPTVSAHRDAHDPAVVAVVQQAVEAIATMQEEIEEMKRQGDRSRTLLEDAIPHRNFRDATQRTLGELASNVADNGEEILRLKHYIKDLEEQLRVANVDRDHLSSEATAARFAASEVILRFADMERALLHHDQAIKYMERQWENSDDAANKRDSVSRMLRVDVDTLQRRVLLLRDNLV